MSNHKRAENADFSNLKDWSEYGHMDGTHEMFAETNDSCFVLVL